MSRFSVAKAKVLDHLENIVGELFPGKYAKSHRRKSLWNVINPYRGGSSAEQMVVWLQGARRGAWKDFVSGFPQERDEHRRRTPNPGLSV